MINKIAPSIAAALADVKDGSTVMIGGFGTAGIPNELIDGLIAQGAKDLVIVNNNAGNADTGLAALLKAGRVRKIICSFPRQADSYVFDELYRSGKLELELVNVCGRAEVARGQAGDQRIGRMDHDLDSPGNRAPGRGIPVKLEHAWIERLDTRRSDGSIINYLDKPDLCQGSHRHCFLQHSAEAIRVALHSDGEVVVHHPLPSLGALGVGIIQRSELNCRDGRDSRRGDVLYDRVEPRSDSGHFAVRISGRVVHRRIILCDDPRQTITLAQEHCVSSLDNQLHPVHIILCYVRHLLLITP